MVAKLYSYELKTRSAKWPVRKGLLLEWNDGWGEVAPLPGFSAETLEEAREEIETLLPRLASATPRLPSVQFGINAASRPFSRKMLKIPMGLLNDPRPGFSTLKLKLGHLSIEQAVEYVKRFVGSYRLRLDCNRAWTLDEALSFASHFSPRDFEYLEEPVHTFQDLLRFSELTHFGIAVDESITQFPCHQIPTLKAIVVKPTVVGVKSSAPYNPRQRAEALYKPMWVAREQAPLPGLKGRSPFVVLSSAYESSLGLLQIARLYEEGDPPPGLDTFRFFEEDLLIPPLVAEEGFLLWPGTNACPIDRTKLCQIA